MSDPISSSLRSHYGSRGLTDRLLSALTSTGHDLDDLDPDVLAGADEFHLGGRAATAQVIDALAVASGGAVLDVGCGIGGAARVMARERDWRVIGIDLTPEFVHTARDLTGLVGLEATVAFVVGSGSAIPVPDQTFDGVTMLHVGMNVEDKAALCREFARVLRPGGAVVVYDVMRVDEGELAYPLPWASSAATSFVASPHDYRAALENEGLAIIGQPENCVALVMEVLAAAAEGPPAPVNLSDLMGQDFPNMISNLRLMLDAGVLAPVRIVAVA